MKEVKLIIISFIFALLIIPMNVNAEEGDPYCLIKTSEFGSNTARLDWDCEDDSSISSFTVYESDVNGSIGKKIQAKHFLTYKHGKGSWEIPSNNKKFENGKYYIVSVKMRRDNLVNGVFKESTKVYNTTPFEFKPAQIGPAKPGQTVTSWAVHPSTTTRVTTKRNSTEVASIGGTTTVAASIKSNNNFICNEGYALGKKDKNGNDILTFRGLLKKYWSWVTFLVPFALIGFISYDFIRAVTSNDSDAVKKSSSNAFKRVIAAILLLLLPYFVYVIMGWFGLTFCFY